MPRPGSLSFRVHRGQSTARDLLVLLAFYSGAADARGVGGKGGALIFMATVVLRPEPFTFSAPSRKELLPFPLSGCIVAVTGFFTLWGGGRGGRAAVVSIPDVLKADPLHFHSSSLWEETRPKG